MKFPAGIQQGKNARPPAFSPAGERGTTRRRFSHDKTPVPLYNYVNTAFDTHNGHESEGTRVGRSIQDKAAERAFFDELAAGGESFKPKPEEEYELVFRELGLDRDLGGIRVLEAGCATGEFGVRLARRNARVLGVDLSEGMVSLNRKLNRGVENYRCMAGDIEDTGLFEENTFDAVVCFNVLHHFPDCRGVIENFARWLRDGGLVYAEEPNGGNPTNRISKLFRKVTARLFPGLLHAKKLSSENEERDYTMREYEEMFGACGFRCRYKNSIVTRRKLPEWHGPGLNSAIAAVKWLLYLLSELLTADRMNRGAYLVFIMELDKTAQPPAPGKARNPIP